MRTFKLITRFYGELFLANFLVSLSCLFLLSHFGKHPVEIMGILFWYKVITIVAIFYLAAFYKKNEFYYYQHLGIPKIKLIVSTSLFDFLLWLGLMIVQLAIGIPGYIFHMVLWSVLLIHLYLYTRK